MCYVKLTAWQSWAGWYLSDRDCMIMHTGLTQNALFCRDPRKLRAGSDAAHVGSRSQTTRAVLHGPPFSRASLALASGTPAHLLSGWNKSARSDTGGTLMPRVGRLRRSVGETVDTTTCIYAT